MDGINFLIIRLSYVHAYFLIKTDFTKVKHFKDTTH